MTALRIRKLPWRFGPDVPFQWNAANPAFGLGMNTPSFIGPPFERRIVLAVREALHASNRHVPKEVRLVDDVAGPSAREIASLLYRLLRSQTPWHRQVDEPVPPFAAEWLAAWDAGRNVAEWYAR